MLPSIIHKIFRYPRFSETLKGCPPIFSALWDKKFSSETCDTPYYAKKFSDTPNFLKHRRNANVIFRHCETKCFRRKIVIPPFLHKSFRYPKASETLKECPRNFSACETKIFRRKLVIPPIMRKIFRYPGFSETLKGCPRNFSALLDKIFST